MASKSRLGKGLGALFPTLPGEEPVAEQPAMIESVPVGAMVVTVALRMGSPSLSVLSPKSGNAPRVFANARLALCPVA